LVGQFLRIIYIVQVIAVFMPWNTNDIQVLTEAKLIYVNAKLIFVKKKLFKLAKADLILEILR
jgi:hypothetical protein